tara:strand:- start:401 stop:517 length:117 start_codon:yes stop_codon:yes gene_type:complete
MLIKLTGLIQQHYQPYETYVSLESSDLTLQISKISIEK